jgi:hypothetical protein
MGRPPQGAGQLDVACNEVELGEIASAVVVGIAMMLSVSVLDVLGGRRADRLSEPEAVGAVPV